MGMFQRRKKKEQIQAEVIDMSIIGSISNLCDKDMLAVDINKPFVYMSLQLWREAVCQNKDIPFFDQLGKLMEAIRLYINFVRAYRRGMADGVLDAENSSVIKDADGSLADVAKMVKQVENGWMEIPMEFPLPFVVGNSDASEVIITGECINGQANAQAVETDKQREAL